MSQSARGNAPVASGPVSRGAEIAVFRSSNEFADKIGNGVIAIGAVNPCGNFRIGIWRHMICRIAA